jgi:chromosome segregation ATPase
MKTYLKLMTLPFLLLACSGPQNPDNVPENDLNDSLTAVATTRVTAHNEWLADMRRISKTLDSINTVRNTIYLKTKDQGEFTQNAVSDINSRIMVLNTLLKRNGEDVLRLNKRLSKAAHLNAGLKDSINSLNNQLVEKQQEVMDLYALISELDSEFHGLEAELYTLYAQNAIQNARIVKSIEEANTVYYAIGTKTQLQKKAILDKNTGLIGLGPALLNNEMDPKLFTKADQREVKEFELNSRHVKLMTIHSTSSYKLQKEGKTIRRLLITDPAEFWRISRFLVIRTD